MDEKLKKGPVYYYYKLNYRIFLIMIFVYLAIILLILFPLLIWDENLILIIFSMFLPGIIFVPFAIYFRYKLKEIMNTPLVNVQRVKLEKIVTDYSRLAGFEVEIYVNGTYRKVETPHVFGLGVFGKNLLQNYINQEVDIVYNENMNKAIVITEYD